MGYTHYWHRPEPIPDELFREIAADFGRMILPLSDFGVELAGGLGKGPPAIAEDMICFNGVQECGHPGFEDLVIPYPTDDAEGIGPAATAIASDYSFGVLVKHRSCNGQCSYETFTLERDMNLRPGREPDDMGLYVGFTKTGFRPYDIAVTAALLIAKHHLGDRFIVHSNGLEPQWKDAKRMCQQVLGYGDWFGIVEEPVIENEPGPDGTTEKRTIQIRTLIEIRPPA